MGRDYHTLLWLKILTDSRLTKSKIIKTYIALGGIDNIFKHSREDYERLSFLKEEDVDALLNDSFSEAQKVYDYMLSEGIGMISIDMQDYPESLLDIPTPPPVLFYRGDKGLLNEKHMVSIVGARTPSSYGKDITDSLSSSLAKSGFCVVSGMADGVDSIAHRGALSACGKTIAVLGSGVDVIYPKENFDLYSNLCKKGLVISEYLPKTRPEKYHFPERNKIIAALSGATCVTEAKEKSGSLITADLCLKYGRKLFAVPGSITSSLCKGTNTLIKNGASPVTDASDIAVFFGKDLAREEKKEENKNLSPEQNLILDAIEEKAVSIDVIKRKTGFSLTDLSTHLLLMELDGLIKQTGAGLYALASK